MIKVSELLKTIPHISFYGRKELEITKVVSAKDGDFSENTVTWISDKNIHLLKNISAGTVICSDNVNENEFTDNCNYIISGNPRRTFTEVVNLFFKRIEKHEISSSAIIHESVKVGQNVNVGHFVIIENDVIIGDNVSIDHNTIIKSDCHLHNNVKIGCNCTLGGVGFGYEKDKDNNYELISHLGHVELYENVEIGNNTCIDKAVLGSTILRENVKVDNLVHIAHGVEIGRNSVVIANSMVAGSVKTGSDVWIAPSASIINNIKIDSDSVIGLGAVVIKNVERNQIIVGNPGKPLSKKD